MYAVAADLPTTSPVDNGIVASQVSKAFEFMADVVDGKAAPEIPASEAWKEWVEPVVIGAKEQETKVIKGK